MEPAVRAEPAGWHLGNVQQAMTANADQLGSVPCEEGPRWLPDASWIRQLAETYGAALSLVSKRPAQGKEANGKRGHNLDVFGGPLACRSAEIGKVDRSKV